MGRPVKEGLDYFELDCQLDDKIKLIQAEFGLKGFAIVVKLFQKIYGGHGYYCEWTDDTILLFMSENGLDSEKKSMIHGITEACIRRKLFSAELYEKYQILTSPGIQKRYLNAVSRREHVKLEKAYLLVQVDQNQVSAYINEVNVNRNPVNADRSTQSREEKSREENNRVKHRASPADYARMIRERNFSRNAESVLEEFLRYKKTEKRFTYKEIGLKNLLDEFQENITKHGETAVIGLVKTAMANGYQGIPWDRLQQKSGQTRRTGNRFNNFGQRDYDWRQMEKEMTGGGPAP